MTEYVEPNGMQLTITDTGYVIVEFDHGEIPPIKFTPAGAERTGSYLVSASNRVRDGREL